MQKGTVDHGCWRIIPAMAGNRYGCCLNGMRSSRIVQQLWQIITHFAAMAENRYGCCHNGGRSSRIVLQLWQIITDIAAIEENKHGY